MARLPEKTAEKHLAYRLQLQAEMMARRGIDAEVIARELQALERAIRAEFQQVIVSGDRLEK
jgi:hypothetical protein